MSSPLVEGHPTVLRGDGVSVFVLILGSGEQMPNCSKDYLIFTKTILFGYNSDTYLSTKMKISKS